MQQYLSGHSQIIPSGLLRMGIDQFPVANIDGTPKSLDVGVAVLDSGIDPHEDLSAYQCWSSFSDNCNDDVGHGTGVAGIIAAIDNQIGVVGVAPGIRLWNIKGFGLPPENSWGNTLGGMEFVLENADQISVVNMSFGTASNGVAPYGAVRGAVQDLVSAGVVVVAAAGNLGQDMAGPDGVFGEESSGNGATDDFVPAALPEAMAVSAMNATNDTLWPLSNFSGIPRTNNHVFSPGGAIDVAAPGVHTLTTAP